ncbi:hypothetical protein EVAR_41676_1 [Eumeta japonica]|uniref:Uncharacterized protein n=1 Tax=Eumeta variegata TaxID=151549 RepID=A0A4C1VNA6_EUMVA|nr:hypothetical protein EVAR_41676_1 [Eumeta japonica]
MARVAPEASEITPVGSGKRSSSAIFSDDDSVNSDQSDNTVKSLDKEASDFFQLVKRKSRKVTRRLHKSSGNIPFHTFAFKEERKVKAVIKGIRPEFETVDIKDDFIKQDYLALAMHRMHRRNGTVLVNAIGVNYTDTRLLTALLNRNASSAWSHIGPRIAIATKNQEVNHPVVIAVRNIRPIMVSDRKRLKHKPPKFSTKNWTNLLINRTVNQNQFPPLVQSNNPTVWVDSKHFYKAAGARISRPAPPTPPCREQMEETVSMD